MNPLHVTNSITGSGGGVALAAIALSGALEESGIRSRLLGIADHGEPLPLAGGTAPSALPKSGSFPFPRSAALLEALNRSEADLFHVHGLWSYPSMVIPGVAKRRKVPWLISPHGMLDPWALHNSHWKKRLAALAFENRHLRGAACLHALCTSEADSIRQYGLNNPVVIIPNGVTLPALRPPTTSHPQERIRTLLYLGRLHPKKGLADALHAWSTSPATSGWRWIIAGWNQGGHLQELEDLCSKYGIPSRIASAAAAMKSTIAGEVLFTGAVFGEEKERLLSSSDAFILPSLSEGLPISVLEAWSHQIPVLMTRHCNLPEGLEYGAAMECEPSPNSLASGIEQLLSASDTDRDAMGFAGRKLVSERFSWPVVASNLNEVYRWLAGDGACPASMIK